MDADNSGTLDSDEVRALALKLGSKLDKAQLAKAMNQMDSDGETLACAVVVVACQSLWRS